MQIKYSGPFWDEAEENAAVDAIKNGRWIPSGENVASFERAFSKQFNFKSSLMVNSGSSANLVMLAALKKYCNWNDQAEIIVSPVGFPTTIAPIVQNNLRPVFTDISLKDLNFDLDEVEKAITKRTVAVFLSPVLGNPPDMDRLSEVCQKNSVNLILDGCDSLGTKWYNRNLSDYASATSCSFYPAHHITTGEGGMVSSNNEELIKLARQFAWWGRACYCVGKCNELTNGTCGKRFHNWLDDGTTIDHKYVFDVMGYNLKPLDLQGAIGLEQLKKFERIHFNRIKHKNHIGKLFEDHIPGLRVIKEHYRAVTSWFGVPIVTDTPELKERLISHLEANKVQTRHYFAGNILKHRGYEHLGNYKYYPNANEVLKRVFFVGCHPGYNEYELAYIENVIRGFKCP